jgi:hypothetical protein
MYDVLSGLGEGKAESGRSITQLGKLPPLRAFSSHLYCAILRQSTWSILARGCIGASNWRIIEMLPVVAWVLLLWTALLGIMADCIDLWEKLGMRGGYYAREGKICYC